MIDDRLLDALDRLRGAGIEFDGFLANHGPMAAEALVSMGAGAIAAVGGGLPVPVGTCPAPEPTAAIAGEKWREHLGDERRTGDWRRFSEPRPVSLRA